MKATLYRLDRATSEDMRKNYLSFRAYSDGAARNIADAEYFTKHNICSFDFKCKSWGRVGAFAARMEADAIAKAVEAAYPGTKVEVKFSRTAGCSCGCSPGFVGKITELKEGHRELCRATVYVKETLEEGEAEAIKAYADKQALGLPKEIEEGRAQVAAEKAAREVVENQKRAERQARLDQYARWDQERAEQQAQAALDSAAL